MNDTFWYLVVGALLVFMALAGSLVKRLPLSMDMLYLAIGMVLGPVGFGLLMLEPLGDANLLEHVTEVAVLFSLFSAGLKLRAAANDPRWLLPLRLAFGVTILTIALVAAAGVFLLGLPLGVAILVGAILAPTDPVLASSVQVENAGDRDRVRFGLTGEAGFNDGMAFPFVMLGLGLMGLHELGPGGLRWVAVDLVWGVVAGLGIGWLLGKLLGDLVLYLRREHQEALGLDEFLALGLVALSYGAALLLHAYGFLAVFAAGLALRRIEHMSSGAQMPEAVMGKTQSGQEHEAASHPQKGPAYMAKAMLVFNEQLERVAEVCIVLIIGAVFSLGYLSFQSLLITALLFLVIRPLAVAVMLAGAKVVPVQRKLLAWFGIRGIGSFYYLVYAVNHGLPEELAERLTGLVLTVIAGSIILHGISATPLMRLYGLTQRRRQARG
jgi:NhaP-type Na+/H+ or K+/H+ antiporter